MSEWAKGYRSAIDDVETMARSWSILSSQLVVLLTELRTDAKSIEREIVNREQKRKLRETKK